MPVCKRLSLFLLLMKIGTMHHFGNFIAELGTCGHKHSYFSLGGQTHICKGEHVVTYLHQTFGSLCRLEVQTLEVLQRELLQGVKPEESQRLRNTYAEVSQQVRSSDSEL